MRIAADGILDNVAIGPVEALRKVVKSCMALQPGTRRFWVPGRRRWKRRRARRRRQGRRRRRMSWGCRRRLSWTETHVLGRVASPKVDPSLHWKERHLVLERREVDGKQTRPKLIHAPGEMHLICRVNVQFGGAARVIRFKHVDAEVPVCQRRVAIVDHPRNLQIAALEHVYWRRGWRRRRNCRWRRQGWRI